MKEFFLLICFINIIKFTFTQSSSSSCKDSQTEINFKCVDCNKKYNKNCISCDKYACTNCAESFYTDFKGACLPCSDYSDSCKTCTDKKCLTNYDNNELYNSSNLHTEEDYYLDDVFIIKFCDQNRERGGENCCSSSYFFSKTTIRCHSCKFYHELCRECNFKDCTQCYNTKEIINGTKCQETSKVNFSGVIITVLIILALASSLFFFAKYILIKFKFIKIAEHNVQIIHPPIQGNQMNQVNINTPNIQNQINNNFNNANNPYSQDLNMINSEDRFKVVTKDGDYTNVDDKSSFYAPGEEGSVIKSNIDVGIEQKK
jgi:hypothetical protein